MSKMYSGYVVPPKKDSRAEGYDEKTGIRTSPKGNEHILVAFKHFELDNEKNPVKKNGMISYRKDYMNVYPADGAHFTEAEKKLLKPNEGFNFSVNHDVETNRDISADGRKLPANVNLDRGDGTGYTISRNNKASRSFMNKDGRAYKDAERKAAFDKQIDWVKGLDKISGSVVVADEPTHYYSEKFGKIMTSIPIEPKDIAIDKNQISLENGLKLKVPYSRGEKIQIGDMLSLKEAGIYTNKDNAVNLHMPDQKGITITESANKQKTKDTFRGELTGIYVQKDGSYAAYVYSEDRGENAKQTVLRMTPEQAEPILEQANGKQKDLYIPISGTGEKSLGVNSKHTIREEFDLTKKGSTLKVERSDPEPEKTKAKEQSEEKTATRSKTSRSRKSTER